MNGINNINQWCQNYINDDGKSTIDLGCKNKELIKKCKQINQICDYNKWEPKKIVQEDELTGTCALPCKIIISLFLKFFCFKYYFSDFLVYFPLFISPSSIYKFC